MGFFDKNGIATVFWAFGLLVVRSQKIPPLVDTIQNHDLGWAGALRQILQSGSGNW